MLVSLMEIKKELRNNNFDSIHITILKNDFLKCRKSYKKIQPFSSYFFPASEQDLNGPLVAEIEDESEKNPQIEYPHGFQLIEEYLWSGNPQQWKNELNSEIDQMTRTISTFTISFTSIVIDEEQFINAIQYQIIRTFFLDIIFFDTPKCKSALSETRINIQSIADVFNAAYKNKKENKDINNISNQLNRTLLFFKTISTLDSLSYLECLRDYYVPLSKSFTFIRNKFVKKRYYQPTAIDFNLPSLFDVAAFNSFFYNPRGTNSGFSKDVAALGKTLFFDPVFSNNNKRACSSCHKPEYAFTDNVKTATGFHETEHLLRNTPTILNAALQRSYFYDMRADHLEMQVGHVLTNEKEMASNFDTLIQKLNASNEYVEYFKNVFKGSIDTNITLNSITNAIAEYERTLISFNSKFDRNVRGEENTFSREEQNGFNIFMNKGRCASCHYLPLFNNLVPPIYTKSEWEIIGTTENSDMTHPKLDTDPGRGGLYGTKLFMNAFKTPTLRNVAYTAPYMHNGAFRKLEDVIDFYNNGGGKGLGLNVPNQTLSADSLHLSKIEKKELVSFLHTLSDTTNLTSKPSKLPSYSKKSVLNKRKIGGDY